MKKKHIVLIIALICLAKTASFAAGTTKAQTSIPGTTQLLLSYIENDAELKNLSIAAKKLALSYDSAKIDNGLNVNLSSGNVTIKLTDDGTSISAKPSVKASLPQASNLSANVSSNINYSKKDSNVTDTSFSLGLDIISDSNIKNKVTLLKAQRSVSEAEHKIGKRVLSVEKEFYTQLKSLLSTINSIMSLEEDYYTDRIDFEAKKIQGYSTASSTYRKAELKVISDQHEIESKTHSFFHDCVVFYKKCGFDVQIDENTDLMDLIPNDIEAGEPVNIIDFNKEEYSSIESAKWTYQINSMERSANKNFSLSASAGYTIDNTTTNSDTVDAGLSTSIGGITLGAGVSVPVRASTTADSSNNSTSKAPALTFTLGLTPNTFRKNSITKQQNELTEEQELIAIQSAESEYDTKVIETQQKLDSLLWEQKSILENLSLYEELEKDMSAMYSQGFTSESEYLSAKTNLNSYIIKKVMNQIDLIIYNDDVVMNFTAQNL